MAEELKVAELRENMADVLRQVSGGRRVLIRRYNGIAAALVPVSDYLTLDRLEKRRTQQGGEGIMRKIVLTNISGGEGKTTLARELAYQLAALGHRVALMDTDPQASLTKSLGLHDVAGHPAFLADHTILDVFQVEDAPRLPSPLNVSGVDFWPSNDHLLKADSEIASDLSKQGNLRDAVMQLEGYDFLIIDTKPGVTPLLNAAVAAADHIVVPVSGDKGMENLQKLSRLMKAAQGFSPHIKVSLFVPNRQRNTVLARSVLKDLQDYQEFGAISRPIRDSVTVGEAYRMRKPLVEYAPKADVTGDFKNVTEDLLRALEE